MRAGLRQDVSYKDNAHEEAQVCRKTLFDEDFGRRNDEVRIAVIHNETLPAHD